MAETKYTVRTKRTRTTTEIIVEREEFAALRAMRTRRGWCQQCSAETNLITAEEAAAALQVSVAMIHEWIRNGGFHFAGLKPGIPLVCLASTRSF